MIDLHTHSRASDGLDTPEALAAKAIQAGVHTLALTDHDTVEGVVPLLVAAEGSGLCVIPGVEFDTDLTPGTLHILGYFIDPEDPGLRVVLSRLREAREERMHRMIEVLADLGFPIDAAEVRREARGGSIGRPHVAWILVARRHVSSIEEAFNRFLAEGRPAYVECYRESPELTIRRIREAGGVAVMAHPKTLKRPWLEVEGVVERLQAAGLGGIEVYYPDHSPGELRRLCRMAQRWGLVATGGTDYHGERTGLPRLGVGYGNFSIPESVVENLAGFADRVRR